MLDDVDTKLLEILQTDGRTSNAELARRVGMAPSAVFERVKRLEERRVIKAYGARLDPRQVERSLLAFILVRSDESPDSVSAGEALAGIADVLEVHHVAGQDSYLCKVRVADPEALGRLLREQFGAISSVRATQTVVALSTLKEGTALPLPASHVHEKAARRG